MFLWAIRPLVNAALERQLMEQITYNMMFRRVEPRGSPMETVGVLRKTRHRGTERVGWTLTFVAAAYNLVCLPKLLAGVA